MKKTLNLGGRLIDLSKPKIMGILNATPDSFYERSRVSHNYELRIEKMVEEGVDILDVGGYSSRPGARDVSIAEEIDRVLPVIEYIHSQYKSIPISLDTFRHEVLTEVLKVGKVIVNDVSGGNLDPLMWSTVARHDLPYILMHMRGEPSTMQNKENVAYEDLILDLVKDLQKKSKKIKQLGVRDIIIDPGIGFAKLRLDNFKIIKLLERFTILEAPILVGLSRKSLIYRTLGVRPEDTLAGTCGLNAIALLNGAAILRVHDVADAVQIRNLMLKGGLLFGR